VALNFSVSTVTTELHASDAGAPNVKVEDVRALFAALSDELGLTHYYLYYYYYKIIAADPPLAI
jgi:hypothetical protein